MLGRQDVPAARYHDIVPEARVKSDIQAQAGPVVALREGLHQGRSDWILVVPCDAPGLTAADLGRVLAAARQSKGPAIAITSEGPLFDLFCAPRTLIEERLRTARRMEDLIEGAVQVDLGSVPGLNVNEPP